MSMVFRNWRICPRIWTVALLAVFLMGQAAPVMAAAAMSPDPLAPVPLNNWTYSALRTLYRSGLLSDWESTLPTGETLMRFEAAMLTQEAILRWRETGQALPPELDRLVRVYLPELELLGWRATINTAGSMETVRFQDLNTIAVASTAENSLVVGGLNLQRLQDGTGQGNYRLVIGSAVTNGPVMVNAVRTQQLLLVGGNLKPVTPLKPGSQNSTSLEGEISLGGNLRVKGGTTYSSGSAQDKSISTEQQVAAVVVFPGIEVGAEFRTKAGGHFLVLDPADSIGGGVTVKIGKVTIQTGLDVLHPSETDQIPAEGDTMLSSGGSQSQPEDQAVANEWNGSQASAGIKVELNEKSVLQAKISLGRERSGNQEKSVTSVGIGYQMDNAIVLLGYRLLNWNSVSQGEAEQQASAELKVEF